MALLFSELEEATSSRALAFRPIYYLGCKSAVTTAIKDAVDEVDPTGGRALDLFAGTGVVASTLASNRDVTAIDIQEYSRVICSATLQPAKLSPDVIATVNARIRDVGKQLGSYFEPLAQHERASIAAAIKGDVTQLIELLESPPLISFLDDERAVPESSFGYAIKETTRRLKDVGQSQSADTMVARCFGGVYFSFEQATALDAALCVAQQASPELRDTLMAVTLSTASTMVNTVGKQFAQPLRPRNRSGAVKPGFARTVFKDRSLDAFDSYVSWLEKYSELPTTERRHQTHRMDYVQALELFGAECSVVYSDPPYTRDHYSRFYHVLETMCLRDNPVHSRVMKGGSWVLSRGVYREDRHQSPFCIRSAAPGAFDALFNGARAFDLPIVLSYSPHEEGDGTHPRVVSMRQIVEIAKKYYRRVETFAVEGVSHNQLNRNGLRLKKREQAEVIVKCFI